MFYAREQTHLQPEITCYLETDNKKQNEVDQEIFRDKGFIKISSWCFVRAEKHTNLLRVRNPHFDCPNCCYFQNLYFISFTVIYFFFYGILKSSALVDFFGGHPILFIITIRHRIEDDNPSWIGNFSQMIPFSFLNLSTFHEAFSNGPADL